MLACFLLVVLDSFYFGKNSKGIETLSGNRKHSQLLWMCGQPALARSLISNILNGKKLLLCQVSVCVFFTVAMTLVRQIGSVVVCLVIRCEFYFQHGICSTIVCAVIFHTSPKLPIWSYCTVFFPCLSYNVLCAHLCCTRVNSSCMQPLNLGYSIA